MKLSNDNEKGLEKTKSFQKTFIISLGGSLIVPDKIDIKFLKDFKKVILDFTKKNRAIIVCGGGKTCRNYQNAAKKITKTTNTDLDWIGIKSIKLNAELVRSIFGTKAHEKVIGNPSAKIKTNKKIIIVSAYKPGCSSDYDAVLIAKNFKADTIINMTDLPYFYDKHPLKYKDAKPLKHATWKQMKERVGTKWKPGLNVPFDPIATKLASKMKLKLILTSKKPQSLNNIFKGKDFEGSIVE